MMQASKIHALAIELTDDLGWRHNEDYERVFTVARQKALGMNLDRADWDLLAHLVRGFLCDREELIIDAKYLDAFEKSWAWSEADPIKRLDTMFDAIMVDRDDFDKYNVTPIHNGYPVILASSEELTEYIQSLLPFLRYQNEVLTSMGVRHIMILKQSTIGGSIQPEDQPCNSYRSLLKRFLSRLL